MGTVLGKLRKGEPMTDDEVAFAVQTIAERRSPMALALPGALFSVGCLYVFGKLDQLDGADPSWAPFIGVLPMLAALNMTGQLHRIGRLKGRAERLVRTGRGDSGNKSAERTVEQIEQLE